MWRHHPALHPLPRGAGCGVRRTPRREEGEREEPRRVATATAACGDRSAARPAMAAVRAAPSSPDTPPPGSGPRPQHHPTAAEGAGAPQMLRPRRSMVTHGPMATVMREKKSKIDTQVFNEKNQTRDLGI